MITALCFRLGKTRAELMQQMSWHEFGQWVAIFMVRPFDDRHLYDLPQALIRATLIGVNGGKPDVAKLEWGNAGKVASLDDWVAGFGKG